MIRLFGHDIALGQLVVQKLDQLPYIMAAFLISYMLLVQLRRGHFFSRGRIIALGGFLLAVQTLVFVFLMAVSYGLIVPQSKPLSTDFVSFYAAGSLAAVGLPELAYDRSAHYEAEQDATETGITYRYFFYPPVFLLMCSALARLPYLGAYVGFEVVTLGLYLIVMRGILREPGSGWLIPVLAFPAVFWTLGYGQNAFLTAALFGGATLLIDRRPVAAGFLFGMLCYKPHFGLLVPVALAAGRRWTAFAATAASVAGWIGVSVALFGWQTWHAYLTAFFGSGTISDFELEHFNPAGFISVFSAARLAGLPIDPAHGIQLTATLAAVVLVGWIWWRNCSLPIRSAALAAGTLIAIPFAVLYDLMLATIAMAWLVRAGRQRDFLRYDEPVIAAIYLIPLLALHLGIALHIPLGPLPALALAALCAVRGSREMRAAARSAPEQGGIIC
jgi:alpha-1,2-mannosyltransferase